MFLAEVVFGEGDREDLAVGEAADQVALVGVLGDLEAAGPTRVEAPTDLDPFPRRQCLDPLGQRPPVKTRTALAASSGSGIGDEAHVGLDDDLGAEAVGHVALPVRDFDEMLHPFL